MIPRQRLWRNAIFNLAGVVLPAVVALLCTPPLLKAIGPTLFGMASIQLAVLVLVSVNDFGISRAVVLVAIERGGFHATGQRLAAVRAGIELVMLIALLVLAISVLGYLGGIAVGMGAHDDRLLSWLLVGVAAAISLPTLPLRARLEIEERFGILNLLRSFGSSLLFAAPLLAAWIHPSLTAIGIAHVLSRLLLLLLFAAVSGFGMLGGMQHAIPRIVAARKHLAQSLPMHAALIRRGGWLGLAGFTSMIIGYADRFVLGIVLGAVSVANYAVASELATKVWLVVGAFTAAATPRIAGGMARTLDGVTAEENTQWKTHFRLLALAVTATALFSHGVFSFGGKPLLSLWLGKAFHPEMTTLLAILSFGIAVNCISQLNYLLLVVKGGERAAAKLQFIVLPVTIVTSAITARFWGPAGVAAAFSLRLIADAMVIRYLLDRRVADIGISYRQIILMTLLCLAMLIIALVYGGAFPE